MKPTNYRYFRLLLLFWLWLLLFALRRLTLRCAGRSLCWGVILTLFTWFICCHKINLLTVRGCLLIWTYFPSELRLGILIWLAVHDLVETHITIFKQRLKLLLGKLALSYCLRSWDKLWMEPLGILLVLIVKRVLIFLKCRLKLWISDLLLIHLKCFRRLIRLLLLCCDRILCRWWKIISFVKIVLRSLVAYGQTCLFLFEIHGVICSYSYEPHLTLTGVRWLVCKDIVLSGSSLDCKFWVFMIF